MRHSLRNEVIGLLAGALTSAGLATEAKCQTIMTEPAVGAIDSGTDVDEFHSEIRALDYSLGLIATLSMLRKLQSDPTSSQIAGATDLIIAEKSQQNSARVAATIQDTEDTETLEILLNGEIAQWHHLIGGVTAVQLALHRFDLVLPLVSSCLSIPEPRCVESLEFALSEYRQNVAERGVYLASSSLKEMNTKERPYMERILALMFDRLSEDTELLARAYNTASRELQ